TLSGAQAAQQMSRILDLQIDAKQMRSTYIQSYEKIKNLLGIPADIEVTFDAPKERTYVETLPTQQELQEITLAYRPELYQLDVQGEIHEQEINEALVKVLPEIAPFISHNYDSNRFLLYNHWTTFGGRALWNLLAIPLALQDREIARDRRRLVCNQRVLLSLGVISQVYLTHALYYDYLDQYYDSRDYLRAKQISYELSVARREKKAIGLADYTYSLADLVLREFEAGRAYANLQGSLEQLNNSIGIPYHFSTTHRACEYEKQPPNFCE
ncbi:MAG: hypothetical protein ACE5GN_05015, partial [Waddliaceae bacterium]